VRVQVDGKDQVTFNEILQTREEEKEKTEESKQTKYRKLANSANRVT
jgi:hypothetical protein